MELSASVEGHYPPLTKDELEDLGLEELGVLTQRAQSDPNWRLRQAAVRTISRVWRKHPETLTILREFARSDQTSSLEAQRDALRSARVAEAAETPKRVWWVRWLMGDDLWSQLEIESPVRGWAVRQQAVQELARYWRQSPEVLEIVKQCAQRDPDWTVRQVAIRELAQGWRRDPEVLVIVKTRITSDSHWRVRKTAVQELVRGWKANPETLAILKQLVRMGGDYRVRQAAIRVLARRWKDAPETLVLLKERTTCDRNSAVRVTGIQELAKRWGTDPEVIQVLRKLSERDEHYIVRYAAKQALSRLKP